jgi:hypothetical protein
LEGIACSSFVFPSGDFRRAGALAIAAILALFALGPVATASAWTRVPCGPAGVTALIAAINDANAAGGGSVDLARGCSYQLTSAYSGEDGLPPVTSAITVNGRDATISGNDSSFRVFEVDGPGGSLTLDDVTITAGNVPDFGGGIVNDGGTLTLSRSLVTGNTAGIAGGGIASGTFFSGMPATTTVTRSQVNGNTVTGAGAGGGIANGDFAPFLGGAPAANSSLTVDHSQVNGNTAPKSGGGGIQNAQSDTTVKNSQVNGNTAANGGGIASGNAAGGAPPGASTLDVKNSEVDGNTSTAAPPPEGPPLGAGGIANGNTASIKNSRIDDNTSQGLLGGGIVNHGTMTITNSVINGNAANGAGNLGSGGGIVNVNLSNPPGAFASGVLQIKNTVVSRNSAGGFGGGILNGFPSGAGGGPMAPASLTITNGLVIANTAAAGGGLENGNGTATLKHTLVIANHPDNCEPLNTVPGCFG